MSYLIPSDIKSNLAQGFDLTQYVAEADLEVNDLAEKLGVRESEDISVPLHYKIKRYAVVFVLMRLAQDKIGTVSTDVSMEKYQNLYEMYKAELRELTPQITYEMVTGNVNSIIARTAVFNLYRG
jgi:hypothetical protein